MNKLSIHFSKFNTKVQLMNQTNSKELVLSAQEARSLHSDIFELLNQFTELAQSKNSQNNSSIDINMDGGKF